MSRLEERLSQQRKKNHKRIWLALAIVMGIVVSAAASYLWFVSGGSFEKASKRVGDALIGKGKVNIIVMGVDKRADDVGRSDTLFVVTLDTETKAVSMLSVPRDTRVKIPGFGWDKINHAYAEGGHKLSMKAVENLLGIPIDYYVLIDLQSFVKVVDALGGVDINVEKRMYYEDPYDDNGLVIDLQPGMQHMNGRTAIQYVRYRDGEGDIGRVARQQKFMKALLQEAASPSIITKIPEIITQISSTVQTDMSASEMLNFAKVVNDASKQGLDTYMVPGKPAYIDDISYWIPDINELRQHVAQLMGAKSDTKFSSASREMETEYEKSIPKEMKVLDPPAKPTKPDDPDKKAVDKPDAAAKPTTDKPDAAKKPSLPATGKVTVEIINASGIDGAGEKMATMLRSKGFDVASVSTMTATYKNTTVVANTANTTVVNKLSGLPFQHSLQVSKEESSGPQATIYIGKDFSK